MKALKLLAASMLAFAVAGSALADTTTVLKITGSSAYRASTVTAYVHALANNANRQAIYDGSSLTGANYATVIGDLASDTTKHFVIQFLWNGSVAGVHIVANNLQAVQFSGGDPTLAWISAPTAAPWGGTNTVGYAAVTDNGVGAAATGGHQATAADKATAGFYDPAATADIAMSDVFQNSTPWRTPALIETNVAPAKGSGIGVVDFEWVKGQGCATWASNWNRLKNMTWQAANQLFTNGALPLSYLTGNCNDDNFAVVLTGRDPDSGTRLTAEVEAKYSVFSEVLQFQPQPISATLSLPSGTTILDPTPGCADQLWPAGSLYGVAYDAGNLGFSSGGNLAAYMTIPVDCCAVDGVFGNPLIYVTYLGRNDAKAASSTGAQWLSFNGAWYFANLANYPANYNVTDPTTLAALAGTPYTLGFCPITRGQYTMWSYEHMLVRSTFTGDANKAAVKAAAVTALNAGDDAISGISLSVMTVKRTADGAVPTKL